MVRKLSYSSNLARAGDSETIKANALDGSVSLTEGESITVWAQQVPADKQYAHGFGTRNRQDSRSSFMHANLVASGDGAGNQGDPIEARVEVEIQDSEQRDSLFRYSYGDSGNLADAADDRRTERPMQPALNPAAREDRHITINLVADADSDGVQIDTDASDMRFWYTEVDA